MSEGLGEKGGSPKPSLSKLYRLWAEGGTGLCITGNVMVDSRALGEPGNVVIEDDRHLEALSQWAAEAKVEGTHCWVQLNHPGKQSPKGLNKENVAPSAIPFQKDMQTFFEHRGDIQGKTVAWIGDGNNMCQSYINAAKLFDFRLNIACPKQHRPKSWLIDNNPRVQLFDTIEEAVRGAALVATDVWASMGQEQEQAERLKTFASFQVTCELMDKAHKDAIFMHCLPAHRGEEVSAELMNDPRAVVWDEAENRLHAQKALIEFLFEAQLN
jgi:hypothetical protein